VRTSLGTGGAVWRRSSPHGWPLCGAVSTSYPGRVAGHGVAALTLGLARDADGMLYRLGDGHVWGSLCRDSSMAHRGLAGRQGGGEGCVLCVLAGATESEVRSAGKLDGRPRLGGRSERENASRRQLTRSHVAPFPTNSDAP
jgi:hypothetical protein